jgi:GDP-L-fucose synthase
MENYNEPLPINVGTGTDLSIMDLALLIKKVVGYKGEIKKDTTKPDGTPQKLMDVTKINLMGWKASISLENGIQSVYEEMKECFIEND